MKARMFRCIGLLLLLVLASFFTLHLSTRATGQANQLTVSFIGPNSVHLEYNFTPDPRCDQCQGALEVVVDDEVTQLRALYGSSQEKVHHQDLVVEGATEFTYRIVQFYYRESDGQKVIWSKLPEATVTVDGYRFGGAMLFNETLSRDLACAWIGNVSGARLEGVIVPANITLTLTTKKLVSSTQSECAIGVYGTLEFKKLPSTERIILNLYSPHNFDGLQSMTLNFREGSARSKVTGGSYLTISADDTSVIFDALSQSTVSLHAGANSAGIIKSNKITVVVLAEGVTIDRTNDAVITGRNARYFGAINSANLHLTGTFYGVELARIDGLSFDATAGGSWRVRNSTFKPVSDSTRHRATLQAGAELSFVDNTWEHPLAGHASHNVTVLGPGALEFVNDTFLAQFHLRMGANTHTSILRSKFQGLTMFSGAVTDLTIHDNRFAGVVELQSRSAANIRRNIFRKELYFAQSFPSPEGWTENSGLSPTVEDNSFVGAAALRVRLPSEVTDPKTVPPVRIGRNYYGDPGGPLDTPIRNWLDRGAIVDPDGFFIFNKDPLSPHWKLTGAQWENNDVFPNIWMNHWLLGQHVFSHYAPPLVQGKESLLSLDLVTSHKEVHGAKVWAVWDGNEVEPTTVHGPVLYRDNTAGGRRTNLHNTARSTVDFILPPVYTEQSKLEVWLDTRYLSGFPDAEEQGEKRLLIDLDVPLRPPPGPIGVALVPITVDGKTPSVYPIADALHNLGPAMLPILPGNIRTTYHYNPTDYYRLISGRAGLAILTNLIANDLVDFREKEAWDPVDRPTAPFMDLVVGVLPEGALDGADGVYMSLRRNVVLVDESKPEAVFHEWGHALGLYLIREQYTRYPPRGREIEGTTLFHTVGVASHPSVVDLFADSTRRIRHEAWPGQWWHVSPSAAVDVMGNQKPIWMHPATYSRFVSGIYALASRPTAPATPHTASTGEHGVRVSLRIEPIEVTERTWFRGESRCIAYRPIPDSVRIVPLPDWPGAGVEREPHMPEFVGGSLPLCAEYGPYADGAGDIQLCFHPKDATGASMLQYYQCVRLLPGDDMDTSRFQDLAIYRFTTSAQAAAHSVVVSGPPVPTQIWEVRAGTELTVELLEPAPGTPVGDTVTLRWRTHHTPVDPSRPSPQPMLHQAHYSVDNGAIWTALGMPTALETLQIPSELLPPSVNLIFRVSATDGVQTTHQQVGGIRVDPRPPLVSILSPQPGDRAPTGYAWTLHAWGWDPDERIALVGEWRSSRDGVLGLGPLLNDIALSAGEHQLSYTVSNAQGNQATAQTTVTVGPMPTVDLALTEDALSLTMDWRDPVVVADMELALGRPQTATLHLRNTGVEVTATVQLYLRTPGGNETLVVEDTLYLEPFETGRLHGVVLATESGVYRLRGVVTALSPSDSNPANNQAVWEIATRAPASLWISNDSLNFSGPLNSSVRRTLTFANLGGIGLIITDIELRQEADGLPSFSIWQDSCTGRGLSAETSCNITLQYVPRSDATLTAELLVNTNTRAADDFAIQLTGRVGTAEPASAIYLPQVAR